MRRFCGTAAVLMVSAHAAGADATAMCLGMSNTTEAQCTCATDALAEAVGTEDAALYDTVGARYLANRETGQNMGDAWDAALADTAGENGLGRTSLMTRMNDVGIAHRAAIKDCG